MLRKAIYCDYSSGCALHASFADEADDGVCWGNAFY